MNIKCGFCKGTGKDPFDLLSQLAVCQVCKGTGKVEVEEPPTYSVSKTDSRLDDA